MNDIKTSVVAILLWRFFGAICLSTGSLVLLYQIAVLWTVTSTMGISLIDYPGLTFGVIGELTPALVTIFASILILLFSRKLGELISKGL